jgi:hypothetical protein
LKPVNRSLARITAIIGFTGSGIKTFARLFYYAPLILLGGASYLSAIPPAQLEALSLAFIRLNSQGAAIALIFFGFETVFRGWLLFKSGFLPRFLGVFSMIGGLGWLTYLWPPLGSQLFMGVALFAIVGVGGTSGWLFIAVQIAVHFDVPSSLRSDRTLTERRAPAGGDRRGAYVDLVPCGGPGGAPLRSSWPTKPGATSPTQPTFASPATRSQGIRESR